MQTTAVVRRRKTTHTFRFLPQGGGASVHVTLLPVSGAETCPITCDEIGSPDTVVPYAPSDLTPLKAHPELACAVMSCGHRYHAPALLVHFMRNGLTCPMCRAGTAALPTKTSLPIRQEEWFRKTYDAIAHEHEEDARIAMENDQAVARAYVMDQTRMLVRSGDFVRLLRNDEVTVTATIYFYRTSSNSPHPLLGMALPMHVVMTPGSSEVR